MLNFWTMGPRYVVCFTRACKIIESVRRAWRTHGCRYFSQARACVFTRTMFPISWRGCAMYADPFSLCARWCMRFNILRPVDIYLHELRGRSRRGVRSRSYILCEIFFFAFLCSLLHFRANISPRRRDLEMFCDKEFRSMK